MIRRYVLPRQSLVQQIGCYFSATPGPRTLIVDRKRLDPQGSDTPTARHTQSVLQSSLRSSVGGGGILGTPAVNPLEGKEEEEEDTPLGSMIRGSILARGPMSVADFMGLCLGHPQFGYYMRGDVFGAGGDFTTSPEVSPLFGELIGVWCVAVAQGLGGGGRGFTLVEAGPGRGTLTLAVLRVLSRFPALAPTLKEVHLVETSPALRRVQATTLGCTNVTLDEAGSVVGAQVGGVPMVGGGVGGGLKIRWWSSLDDMPRGGPPPIMLLHELFDALPTHQLSYTGWAGGGKGKWRELLVDVLVPTTNTLLPPPPSPPGKAEEPPMQFRQVLAPGLTPAAVAWEKWLDSPAGVKYRARVNDAGTERNAAAAAAVAVGGGGGGGTSTLWPSVGSVGECSPAAQAAMSALCSRVKAEGGVALVVDYGGVQGARSLSLRGIRGHKFVDPFSCPGLVDLSVDVDFAALGVIAEAEGGCRVLGPTTQGAFLQRLGLVERLERLAKGLQSKGEGGWEDSVERLYGEAKRLAHPSDMGNVYKVMAIFPEEGGKGEEVEGLFK